MLGRAHQIECSVPATGAGHHPQRSQQANLACPVLGQPRASGPNGEPCAYSLDFLPGFFCLARGRLSAGLGLGLGKWVPRPGMR